MKDVTKIIENYRDCSRNVWNQYFRHLDDGWHEFINVDNELFYALVNIQIVGNYDQTGVHASEFGTLLKVIPLHGDSGIEAMWAKEENHILNWQTIKIESDDVDLHFIGFFDFANDDEYHDYQYIRTRINTFSKNESMVGADMILPANNVEVYYNPKR